MYTFEHKDGFDEPKSSIEIRTKGFDLSLTEVLTKIQTERLELVLLTPPQLKLWTEDMTALEKELNCVYRAEPMIGFFLDIVKEQLKITQKDSENHLWHSFFLLIRKDDRTVLGSAEFKDIPNQDGEVEIGYGLGEAFEHNGYMTEAVKAMCQFALKQNAVASVIAETDLDGFASQRIFRPLRVQKVQAR